MPCGSKDGASVNDPSAIVKAYANLFIQAGGKFEKCAVSKVERAGERWTLDGGVQSFSIRSSSVLAPGQKSFSGKMATVFECLMNVAITRHYVGDGSGKQGAVYTRL